MPVKYRCVCLGRGRIADEWFLGVVGGWMMNGGGESVCQMPQVAVSRVSVFSTARPDDDSPRDPYKNHAKR